MTDNFLGELRVFAFGRVPRHWLPCNGQLLALQQYQALFALIGYTFGGDGKTNFALPDLRGRVAVGTGQAQGGTLFQRGQKGGAETITLTPAQTPPHIHAIIASTSTTTTTAGPNGNYIGVATATPVAPPFDLYGQSPPSPADSNWVPLHSSAIALSGSGGAHENRQPVLALQICIATAGVWPSRN